MAAFKRVEGIFPVKISREKKNVKFFFCCQDIFRKFNFYHFDGFSSNRIILKRNQGIFSAFRLIRRVNFFFDGLFLEPFEMNDSRD